EDRFGLLTGGSRVALPRQQTLEAAVDWGYGLLTAGEQSLFRRLSVIRGPFDVGLAEQIAGGSSAGAEVAPTLAELVDKSLVVRTEDAGGYRLLETLRAYGWLRVDEEGSAADLRRRHAQAFVGRAEEAADVLRGPEFWARAEVIGRHHEDYLAALATLVDDGSTDDALRLTFALWRFWHYRFALEEATRWITTVLALPGGDHTLRLSVLVALASVAVAADDDAGAEDACRRGLELCGPGDDWFRAHLLMALAEVAGFRGDTSERPVEKARLSADLFASEGDAYWHAHARRAEAILLQVGGDTRGAEAGARRCLELFEGCGDREGVAGATLMLSGLSRSHGDLAGAALLATRALAAFSDIGEPWGVAESARRLAEVRLAQGDRQAALVLTRDALARYQRLGSAVGAEQARHLLARVEAAPAGVGPTTVIDLSLLERRSEPYRVRTARPG
ncbi:MAG TPA: hypothetical protein VFH45_09575, partial [Acidimicrobiales bacterium]|nr:hypothetical protein [Acidimicrobiales bacterium]